MLHLVVAFFDTNFVKIRQSLPNSIAPLFDQQTPTILEETQVQLGEVDEGVCDDADDDADDNDDNDDVDDAENMCDRW